MKNQGGSFPFGLIFFPGHRSGLWILGIGLSEKKKQVGGRGGISLTFRDEPPSVFRVGAIVFRWIFGWVSGRWRGWVYIRGPGAGLGRRGVPRFFSGKARFLAENVHLPPLSGGAGGGRGGNLSTEKGHHSNPPSIRWRLPAALSRRLLVRGGKTFILREIRVGSPGPIRGGSGHGGRLKTVRQKCLFFSGAIKFLHLFFDGCGFRGARESLEFC